MRRSVTFLVAVAVLICAAAAAWLSMSGGRKRPPDVILVVIDTLRRDRLGAYGYHRETSPHIDALADENVLFANAYANSNWTKPSVASLMTGLYVSQHGVTHVVTHQAGQLPTTQRLPEDVTTLAEVFKSKGYQTIGVVENVHISAKLGFAQGFDIWDENLFGATNITNDFLYRLEELESPYFLYIHYFDPHSPYYRTRLFETEGRITPGLQEVKSTDYIWSTYTFGVDRGLTGLSPVERQRLEDLYDGEVRWVDMSLGRIFERLKKRGTFDDSWIIVTSDHGENFYEGKRLTHPHDCFSDSQVRIPLVMKMPGSLGVKERVVADAVQLVDIFPTITAFLGIEWVAGTVGTDLMPAICDNQPLPQRALEAESESGTMYMAGSHKYVKVPTEVGVFEFVYDTASDPLEERNLGTSEPELAAKYAKASSELREGAREKMLLESSEGVSLSEDEIERMRKLGYLH